MKLDAAAYFQCAKDDVKSVKQQTRTWYFAEKIYVSTQEIRPECKVCELRYRPIGTLFFKQEYNLLFPIPKKNVIFNIHHLLFQNQFFFSGQLFKFDWYN